MIWWSGTAVPVRVGSVTREVIVGAFAAAEPKVEHSPETLAEPHRESWKIKHMGDVCSTHFSFSSTFLFIFQKFNSKNKQAVCYTCRPVAQWPPLFSVTFFFSNHGIRFLLQHVFVNDKRKFCIVVRMHGTHAQETKVNSHQNVLRLWTGFPA